MTRVGSLARTVADRGSLSMRPISPKWPPARSSAISTPFFSMATRPPTTMKSSSPGWFSSTISRLPG